MVFSANFNYTVSHTYIIKKQAYVLLGQFLVFKKDEDLFTDWFKEETGANKKYSKDAYECLNEWCNSFL